MYLLQLDYRSRLPRHICPYSGVQAYSLHTAQGKALLATLRGGQYSESDSYYAHAVLASGDNPPVAMVTHRFVDAMLLEWDKYQKFENKIASLWL